MTLLPTAVEPFAPAVYRRRLSAAAAEAERRGLTALLITPSPDYAYLLGYRPPALERLTCLVLPASGMPSVVLPRLEAPLARHQLGELADSIELLAWDETDDPFRLVRGLLEGTAGASACRTRCGRVSCSGCARPWIRWSWWRPGPRSPRCAGLKSPEEVDRLRSAAAAADAAMGQITAERLSGRTEAEVSRRVNELLLAAGHETADFAIVASGPNSASPHHEPGDRVIERRGCAGAGHRRDAGPATAATRPGRPSSDRRRPTSLAMYEVLREAQAAACDAVAPGVAAEAVDAAARDVIEEAGYGERFFHRTGHGIGIETHEEPYIVSGNAEPLQVGHAFSVEPGIYLDGRWGARIEDIVVCTETGGERLNRSDRELYLVS